MFFSAPLRLFGVGVVALRPNAPWRRDDGRLKQTCHLRIDLQGAEQGMSVKTDLNGQLCTRAFFFRQAVFVKSTIITFRPPRSIGLPPPLRRAEVAIPSNQSSMLSAASVHTLCIPRTEYGSLRARGRTRNGVQRRWILSNEWRREWACGLRDDRLR